MGSVLLVFVEEGGVEGLLPGVVNFVVFRLDLESYDRRLLPRRVERYRFFFLDRSDKEVVE